MGKIGVCGNKMVTDLVKEIWRPVGRKIGAVKVVTCHHSLLLFGRVGVI